ncbi:putative T7SS-secreted protein [Streptomyces sp. NPDC088197]|uniref:putative T7SS-secreted protein n=1 Tax=Streptomyces sp. NPDC088197 TaxID=3365840 RepID=UPI0037F71C03
MGDARAGKFPLLGFDPTPGDVDRTRALARQLGDLHGELTATVTELDRLDCGYWKGEAATAFVSHIDSDVAPLIKKAHDSFGRASSALSRWADQLHGFQAEADALEKEAATKQGSLDHAKSAADPPHPPGDRPAFVTPAQLGKDAKAQQAVTDATNALDGVRHRAEELHNRFTTAATSISHDLDKAGDIAPDKPGLFSRIAHGVEDAWNNTLQWVKDNADIIKTIGDLLGAATALLGAIAIFTAPFEPVGAFFAAAAITFGAATLATHLVAKLAGADVSWLTLGLDVVGVLPGIQGFTTGAKVAEVGSEAARFSESAVKGLSLTVKAVKPYVLFGERVEQEFIKGSGVVGRSRAALEGVIQFNRTNQLIGTKVLNPALKVFGGAPIEALSPAARAIDGGIKLTTHAVTVPLELAKDMKTLDKTHPQVAENIRVAGKALAWAASF